MELNEVATDTEIRDKNSKLVPELLKKLKTMQEQSVAEKLEAVNERFKRPFALFSKSPMKAPRRHSSDAPEMEGVAKLDNKSEANGAGDSEHEVNGVASKQTEYGSKKTGAKRSLDRGSNASGNIAPGWPVGLMSPPRGKLR